MPEVSTNTSAGSPCEGVVGGSGGSAEAGKLRTNASKIAPKTKETAAALNQSLAKIRLFFTYFLSFPLSPEGNISLTMSNTSG